MPVPPTLEAKVKDVFNLGPVIAFSGYEYIRTEWRPVPVGSEPAALVHPMLDTREIGGKEIKVTAKDRLTEINAEAINDEPVSTETEAVEDEPVDAAEDTENAESEPRKPRAPRRTRRS